MKFTVLRTFLCGDKDGTHGTLLEVGSEQEISDELVSGLVAEGYIKASVAPAPKPATKPESRSQPRVSGL